MPDSFVPPPTPPSPPTPPPPAPPYTAYAVPPGPVGYAGAVAYPPPRRSGWFWAAVIVGVLGVVVVGVAIMITVVVKAASSGSDSGSLSGEDSIAVIDVEGVITSADKIDKELEKFGKDDNVKAILLHIDSPGGGAAASQEIYHEVLRVRKVYHKRVVASISSVGASGAYYIASGCDQIYANPASVVGSIGVIMEWTNYGDLLKWAKLKNITITHGELKDAGDPTRDLTPKEQAYFQGLVDNMYGQFVRDVAAGRNTTPDKIEPLATGQVWTGEEALPLGLIDKEGGYREALLDTAKAVGLKGEPHVVTPSKPSHGLLGMLTDDDAESLFPNPSRLLDRSPGFFFMWK